MIIVSQDKSVIVNCENMESIEIGNVAENQGKGIIYARLVSDYFYKIGEYKTEERAKEVLKEIARFYRMYGGMKYFKDSIKSEILEIVEEDGQDAFVYTMPEE